MFLNRMNENLSSNLTNILLNDLLSIPPTNDFIWHLEFEMGC